MCQEDVGVRNLYYLTEFATELGLPMVIFVYIPIYVKYIFHDTSSLALMLGIDDE